MHVDAVRHLPVIELGRHLLRCRAARGALAPCGAGRPVLRALLLHVVVLSVGLPLDLSDAFVELVLLGRVEVDEQLVKLSGMLLLLVAYVLQALAHGVALGQEVDVGAVHQDSVVLRLHVVADGALLQLLLRKLLGVNRHLLRGLPLLPFALDAVGFELRHDGIVQLAAERVLDDLPVAVVVLLHGGAVVVSGQVPRHEPVNDGLNRAVVRHGRALGHPAAP